MAIEPVSDLGENPTLRDALERLRKAAREADPCVGTVWASYVLQECAVLDDLPARELVVPSPQPETELLEAAIEMRDAFMAQFSHHTFAGRTVRAMSKFDTLKAAWAVSPLTPNETDQT